MGDSRGEPIATPLLILLTTRKQRVGPACPVLSLLSAPQPTLVGGAGWDQTHRNVKGASLWLDFCMRCKCAHPADTDVVTS